MMDVTRDPVVGDRWLKGNHCNASVWVYPSRPWWRRRYRWDATITRRDPAQIVESGGLTWTLRGAFLAVRRFIMATSTVEVRR